MRRSGLPLLLFLPFSLLLIPDGPPRPTTRTERTHNFSTLTAQEAEHLQGKLAKFRIVLDSREWEHEGLMVYDCKSVDRIRRSVSFARGQDTEEDELTVEAVLRIIEHARSLGLDGTQFEGFREYRLTEARSAWGVILAPNGFWAHSR
jgi:hypothetical protein